MMPNKMMSFTFTQKEKENYIFSVEYDIFTIVVSYWTAVLGAYTSIQILDQLIKIYRIYIASNVQKVLLKPPKIQNKTLQNFYIYTYINSKIITTIFFVAIALGACGIWGMHFLGMHALRIYAVPNNTTTTLPIFDPYEERVHQNYFLIIPVYYDIGMTILSLIVSIVTVFIGMLIAAYGIGMIHTRTDAKGLPDIMKQYRKARAGTVSGRHAPPRIRDSKILTGHALINERPGITSGMPSSPNPAVNPQRHSGNDGVQSFDQIGASQAQAGYPTSPNPAGAHVVPFGQPIPEQSSGVQSSTDEDQIGVTINLQNANFFHLAFVRKMFFFVGSIITGLGAALMHYTGVASMRVPCITITHNPVFVVIAIIIGVTVATAGLYILFFIHGKLLRSLAPFVIGAAVFSLHYVAMYGTNFENTDNPFQFNYDEYANRNPGVLGGLVIETIRSQLNFTLELVILAVTFHFLHLD